MNRRSPRSQRSPRRIERRCLVLFVAALVLVRLALGGAEARAGEPLAAGAATPARGANEFGLWGGGSVAPGTMIGRSTGFDLEMAGLRYGRSLWTNGSFSFDWTVDAIPLALLSLHRAGGTAGDRDTVYGAGLAPLGFRVDYEGLGWFRPFFAASGGFLYFAERIPARGVKFNFTYDFGVGTQMFLTPEWAFTLGYAYHHISNGGIGDSNPGFDSNLVYAGISVFR